MSKSIHSTTNAQTVTVDVVGGVITVRIAKDGHNRAVAKLDAATASAIAAALTDAANAS